MLDAIPTAVRLIHSNDAETVANAMWVLTYLSDGAETRQERIAGYPGALEAVVSILKGSNSLQLQVPA